MKKISVFNPDTKDFICKWAGKSYTVLVRDHAYFDKQLGLHIAGHLADRILHIRGTKKDGITRSPHDVKKEILKEILA